LARFTRLALYDFIIDMILMPGWIVVLGFLVVLHRARLQGRTQSISVRAQKILVILNLIFSFIALQFVYRKQIYNLTLTTLLGVAITSAFLQVDIVFSKHNYTNTADILLFAMIVDASLIVVAFGYLIGTSISWYYTRKDYTEVCLKKK